MRRRRAVLDLDEDPARAEAALRRALSIYQRRGGARDALLATRLMLARLALPRDEPRARKVFADVARTLEESQRAGGTLHLAAISDLIEAALRRRALDDAAALADRMLAHLDRKAPDLGMLFLTVDALLPSQRERALGLLRRTLAAQERADDLIGDSERGGLILLAGLRQAHPGDGELARLTIETLLARRGRGLDLLAARQAALRPRSRASRGCARAWPRWCCAGRARPPSRTTAARWPAWRARWSSSRPRSPTRSPPGRRRWTR
jgi:hypothetical protein